MACTEMETMVPLQLARRLGITTSVACGIINKLLRENIVKHITDRRYCNLLVCYSCYMFTVVFQATTACKNVHIHNCLFLNIGCNVLILQNCFIASKIQTV